MASLDISKLREDVEPFQSELMEEFYGNYAGLKDEMSTVGIYERYGHLFSEDAIAEIARAAGRGRRDRRLALAQVPQDLLDHGLRRQRGQGVHGPGTDVRG